MDGCMDTIALCAHFWTVSRILDEPAAIGARSSTRMLRCFTVPRGVTVIAGGTAEPDARTIYYREDTVLEIRGLDELFHHTDENTLKRVE